ncbi:hypothetical protein BHM03_00050793, partial [Ensete ventricosum]
ILTAWLLVVAAAFIGPAECIRRKRQLPGGSEGGKGGGGVEQFKYSAAACRAHTASLADFGGVGDGATSNTAAFQAAVSHLSQFASDGGGMLFVPAGRWLTGPFNLTSSFTLFLHRDAVILATQVISISPPTPPPPHSFWDNGTIDGQGALWWSQFHSNKLKYTRGYLIELMHSNQIFISNLTLLNSPAWNIHPVYSRSSLPSRVLKSSVVLCPLTASAWGCAVTSSSPGSPFLHPFIPPTPTESTQVLMLFRVVCSIYIYIYEFCSGRWVLLLDLADSCSNVRIEDCYIVSGDDCVAIKSGWDEYGISYGMPSQHIVIRRLTCVSPTSAVIALGSEMSGGIRDVRVEDITALNSESGVRIKTAVGRGAYVKDVYVRRMNLNTMKWVFWMTGSYKSHPDDKYNPNAIPVVEGISYSEVVAYNVTMAARLEGIPSAPFTGICVSNVTVQLAKSMKTPWYCADVIGVSSGVTPAACALLADQGAAAAPCPFPTDASPMDGFQLQQCTYIKSYDV